MVKPRVHKMLRKFGPGLWDIAAPTWRARGGIVSIPLLDIAGTSREHKRAIARASSPDAARTPSLAGISTGHYDRQHISDRS